MENGPGLKIYFLLKIGIHPPKQTWNLKMDPWNLGDSYWKPSFPGSMLIFGGVFYCYVSLPGRVILLGFAHLMLRKSIPR